MEQLYGMNNLCSLETKSRVFCTWVLYLNCPSFQLFIYYISCMKKLVFFEESLQSVILKKQQWIFIVDSSLCIPIYALIPLDASERHSSKSRLGKNADVSLQVWSWLTLRGIKAGGELRTPLLSQRCVWQMVGKRRTVWPYLMGFLSPAVDLCLLCVHPLRGRHFCWAGRLLRTQWDAYSLPRVCFTESLSRSSLFWF